MSTENYKAYVNHTIGKWTVQRIVYGGYRNKTQCFEVTCVCGAAAVVICSRLIARKSTQCVSCARREQNARRSGRPVTKLVPHEKGHVRTTLKSGETVCERCYMQPGWPGWDNPCGLPVRTQRQVSAA